MESNSIDSIVTDPPYGINFMGKKWDYDVPSVELWTECLRVLKPGGHGSASRFFYCAKPSKKEKGEFNNHPTVKPLKLMRYLVKLITPEDGICLDPFMGSGTTGLACKEEGFNFLGIEKEEGSYNISKERIEDKDSLDDFFN